MENLSIESVIREHFASIASATDQAIAAAEAIISELERRNLKLRWLVAVESVVIAGLFVKLWLT